MSGLPTIHVVGTITADPELRFTPSGAAVANFTIASNERRLNKDTQQWEDGAATFLRCSIWRDAAENVAESLHRGDRVLASGRLKQREYEKDGVKRTAYELDVDEVGPSLRWAQTTVRKLGRDGGGGGGHGRPSTPSQSSAPTSDPWGDVPPPDSEMAPF